MSSDEKRAAALLARLAAVFVLILWVACVSGSTANAELRARTALEVLREIVDPAFDFADRACTAREHEIVLRIEQGHLEAKQDYLRVERGCIETRAAFRAIRDAHDHAADLLEQGLVHDAEIEIERVRETWRAFSKEKIPL